MLKFYASGFVELISALKVIENLCAAGMFNENDKRMLEQHILPKLKNHAEAIGLKFTLKQIERMGPYEIGDIETILSDAQVVSTRIRDELEDGYFLHLTADEAGFYESTEPPFGHDVASKFPNSVFDIDESAKCLALGRYTSAVFHLMRIMESALRAIHACLGMPPPLTGNDRTWGSILKAIRDNYKVRPAFSEMQTFQELHARLDAVKDAWRNGTMHVENKYTEEEAKYLFSVTKVFVQKLALRMDEGGKPLA